MKDFFVKMKNLFVSVSTVKIATLESLIKDTFDKGAQAHQYLNDIIAVLT